MDLQKLCEQLQFNKEVISLIREIDVEYDHIAVKPIWSKLYQEETWDEGVRQLQEYFGEDENGFKILTCILHCALYTYKLYFQRGISEKIFFDTMKFLPRFLEWHKQAYGHYAFVWAWWFPRQLSLREFRIGELEYELKLEGEKRQIYIHIPSDADLSQKALFASHCGVQEFLKQFFPEYFKVAEYYCDTWLLSPNLRKLLPETSNIRHFQDCFELLRFDEESDAFLEWLYMRKDIPYQELPETTSLQRDVKAYLLEGGRIGWAFGSLKAWQQD